jgi:hypothetical protein
MYKTDIFVADNLDLINQAKTAKVIAQLLLSRTLV